MDIVSVKERIACWLLACWLAIAIVSVAAGLLLVGWDSVDEQIPDVV